MRIIDKKILGTAIILAAVSIAVILELGSADPTLARGAGLIVFAIGFWAFGILPEAVTGMIFLVAGVGGEIVTPSVAFSGFTTSAFWLIFAGLILGAAVSRTGLASWLAARTLPEGGPADAAAAVGYGRLVALIVLLSAGLALVLPSTMGRIVILIPVIAALAPRLGYAAGSRGHAGMILAGGIGTYVVPITFLPANLPNIVLAGSLEALHDVTLTYGSYFLLHFPVIGLIKGLVLVILITVLFGERPVIDADGDEEPAQAPDRAALSPDGRRLAIILLITLLFWASDVVHGIAAAWVGMAAAIACLLPMMRILPFKVFAEKVQLPTLLYIAAVLSLGPVMTATGAGQALGDWLLGIVPLSGAGDFTVMVSMAGMATVMGLAATMPGAPAVAAPLFPEIAQLTGWSIEAVGMAQVFGYATPLLPYQVPPLVVALAMGGVRAADAVKVLLLLAVTTTPIVLPLAYVWWSFLGWMPG
ncbi:SLC13 family permease [Fodinicurvata sp. EGI_FJ10296]|uniref:SLC13 family permease n=1 Tax=Fodinicurvata sp. EGI_FJ10296 TaxID=3231908 RepID=UPI0034538B1D